MTFSIKTPASAVSALLVGLACWGAPSAAQASSTFPPKAQEALSKLFNKPYCVPQCILCHTSNVGGIGTMNSFGKALETKAMLIPVLSDRVQPAIEKYFTEHPNDDVDGDGMSDLEELRLGASPSVALPRGEGLICPDIKYGCGARVAAAPPPADRTGLLAAGLTALLGLTAWRRRLSLRDSRAQR